MNKLRNFAESTIRFLFFKGRSENLGGKAGRLLIGAGKTSLNAATRYGTARRPSPGCSSAASAAPLGSRFIAKEANEFVNEY